MDVAVYLFTGFLEAGKTTLIRETLQDEKFNAGEKTLILACEEGVEEYEPGDLPGSVSYESIETLSQLNPDKLAALQKKHKAERIMIEYNGMWMNEDLYNAMPDNWYVYQEIMLADASTFLNYNANMRSLVVNKLQNCEMVVFNRFDEKQIEKMELHKIVRGVSRRVNIAYETVDHNIEYDEIEDPLPFDLSAPVVEIANRDYAIWYRDMSEEMEKYEGKVLRMTGMVARDPALPAKSFVFGRHVMTCCMDDIAYRGLVCIGEEKCTFESKDWITLTARLDIEYHKLYKSKGPVLKVISAVRVDPLPHDEQLATFY